MIVEAPVFLALLVTVGCADRIPVVRSEGTLLRRMVTASPTARDATASMPAIHPAVRTTLPPTTNTIASTQNADPSVRETSPSPTTNTIASTEAPQPPVHGSCFITDATTSSNILPLPGNESVSGLLFWPPSAGINVTLKITTSLMNYTFIASTLLPQRWHIIDIYQPTESSNQTRVYINPERRYIGLGHTRVLQVQVDSNHSTHWCFCPNAHLCTLLSPLEYGGDASADLLAALLVVVFLLIVTLLALGGVTFYRKSELFHIYAKPVDCLPYGPPPPPLPTPNKQQLSPQVHKGKETKRSEAEKMAAQTEDSDYSMVGGEGADNTDYARPFTQLEKHESINNLYGLI